MSWRETHPGLGRLLALALALGSAGLTAGCFQPLYGTASGTDGNPSVRQAMASVDVPEIDVPNGSPEARLSVEVRNALIFGLTGGSAPLPPTHSLKINLSGNRQQIIVDITTARPDVEIYGIDASYTLIEIATKKVVVTGKAFSRASFDIPGQQQRFARQRGQRDAENRASTILADQIKSRLASYFVSGG